MADVYARAAEALYTSDFNLSAFVREALARAGLAIVDTTAAADMASIVERANELERASVDKWNGFITQAQYHIVYGSLLTAIRTAIAAAEARGREQPTHLAEEPGETT